MAKYCQTIHVHPFSWDQVASGLFLRYPNPFATHVLSEDTLCRKLISRDVLYTRRFLTKTNKLPKWGEKFLGGLKKVVPLVEESIVDKETKTIVTYTRNVGLSRFMTAVERVSYTVHPDNPTQTRAVKEAWIESGLIGLRSAVKAFGIERFKHNCLKATEGFNFVLAKLYWSGQQSQHYLNDLGKQRWQDIKFAAERAKAQAKVHAENHQHLRGKDG